MKPPASAVNRRDLLRLRAIRPRTSDGAPYAPTHRLNGGDLLKATRPGMGSHFELRVAAGTPGGANLVQAALDLIDALELQMTVYRDDSEISRINATAHLGPVTVEPRLFRLLRFAVELSGATGGAYDVAAGSLSEAWGFVRGPRRVPTPEALAEARDRAGSHHLRLDPDRRTVAFDRPGVTINLGSIGKGYALDRVGELVRSYWWPTSGLVHGGRSSLLAIGSPPDQFGGRWRIAVRNPVDPAEPLGVLHLRDRAVGMSGDAFQRFEAGGRTYGHIIDPRSGEPPAGGPASVTVLAPTAAEADALSTALYLMDEAAVATFLADRPEVGALFVRVDGGAPSVRSINLGPDDWTPGPPGAPLGLDEPAPATSPTG